MTERDKWVAERERTEAYINALQEPGVDEKALPKDYLKGSVESGLYPGLDEMIRVESRGYDLGAKL